MLVPLRFTEVQADLDLARGDEEAPCAADRLDLFDCVDLQTPDVVDASDALDERAEIRAVRLATELPTAALQPTGQRVQKHAELLAHGAFDCARVAGHDQR